MRGVCLLVTMGIVLVMMTTAVPLSHSDTHDSLVSASVTVETKDGAVTGGRVPKSNTQMWLSIPYAAPPTGDNRMRSPQPVTPWSSPRDCTSKTFAVAHVCPQMQLGPVMVGQEDCLYLDIYRPANHSTGDAPLPVMVWLYGGSYVFGDGNEFHLYNGARLAEQHNVVVVTPNYRLASLGFFSSDALRAEDPNNSTGNYALLDQRAAMIWVKENAQAFGGNPDKVTIFGESAGGFSVCWHLASPGSAGLFHAAIMESGSCDSEAFFQPYESATKFSEEWGTAAGCDRQKLADDGEYLHCLRQLSAHDLINKDHKLRYSKSFSNLLQSGLTKESASLVLPPLYPAMPWGPPVDGTQHAMPDLPLTLLKMGTFNKVPTIMGTNKDEGSILVSSIVSVVNGTHFPPKDADIRLAMGHFFAAKDVDSIMTQYPASNYKTGARRAAAILREFFFTCGTRRSARALAAHNVAVWRYEWVFDFGGPEYKLLGNFHASELNFVWDNGFPPLVGVWDKRHRAMSSIVEQYWGSFAHSHTPNDMNSHAASSPDAATNVVWPAYNATADINIALDIPPRINAHLYKDHCDFWDTIETKPWAH